MSEKLTTKRLGDVSEDRTDWERLRNMTEEEIEEAALEDLKEHGMMDIDWSKARIVTPQTKQDVHMRIDRDVVSWFKAQGRGYQTRMNAVLRSYMSAHRKPRSLEAQE